jgi:hypothetical protein
MRISGLDTSISTPTNSQERWWRTRQFLTSGKGRWVLAAVLFCAVIGASVGLAASSSTSATAGQVASAAGPAGHIGSGGGASNARSGPAAGGAVGTASSVSATGFTLTTSAGQKVTIKEASSTTYNSGANSISSSAITAGEPVLVLGMTSSTTITASQVIVEPSGQAVTSSAASVVPFQRGAPTTSKQVGAVPTDYTEGSGTIVSGTAANRATTAALAAYPGGVVDRVVKLSNGEYEVHNIGVNWPHHVFVNQDFTVVGAD